MNEPSPRLSERQELRRLAPGGEELRDAGLAEDTAATREGLRR